MVSFHQINLPQLKQKASHITCITILFGYDFCRIWEKNIETGRNQVIITGRVSHWNVSWDYTRTRPTTGHLVTGFIEIDTGFSTSTQVFPPRHRFFTSKQVFLHLDTGFIHFDTGSSNSTQVFPPRHRFFHFDTGFSTSTRVLSNSIQVFPPRHRFYSSRYKFFHLDTGFNHIDTGFSTSTYVLPISTHAFPPWHRFYPPRHRFYHIDTGLSNSTQVFPTRHRFFHLDTGFSWFPCVYKQTLRRFPTFQVATTCFSCSPPDLNLLVTNFMFFIHVKQSLPPGDNQIAVNNSNNNNYYYYYY